MKEIAKLIKLSPKGSTLSSRNLANYEVGVTLTAFRTVIGDFEVTGKTMEEVRDTTDDE